MNDGKLTMKRCILPAVILATLPFSTASAQFNTQRGGVLGGLAGAAAGVAIGEHNDEPLAGALIGGAVGLVTGATLGNARDRQIAESRAYQYRQQQVMQQQFAKTVSVPDVIAMSRSGLSDTVIINHIQVNGVRQEMQVADVITLHENGVSQHVISAMQRCAQSGQVTTSPPSTTIVTTPVPVYQPTPTIVVDPYLAPRYHYPNRRYHYVPHHHHGHGHGAHFSFGR